MDFENVFVNVNFIFLHKNDGTGMFEEGNPEHDSLVEALATKVNEVYSTLNNYNEPGCLIPPEEFLSESKIQIVPNYIYINDEYAWNNENDEYPYCPSPPWYLDYLDEQVSNDPNIENGINVYFTETEWYYDDLIVNQTTEEQGPINHACSQLPTTYDLERSSRVHMPNVFTKYWWMKHIAPDIYVEPWYNTIRGWFINSVGELIAHELGHSFWLYHVSDCEYNIMHPDPISWDTYSPEQIGKMHRSLAITNVRKFSTEDSYITSPYILSSNKLWDLDHTRYQDVIVEEGATLTITCKLVMKNSAKIIVEQGGHLIVDGGIITTEDDSLWKGIEVGGECRFLSILHHRTLPPGEAGNHQRRNH